MLRLATCVLLTTAATVVACGLVVACNASLPSQTPAEASHDPARTPADAGALEFHATLSDASTAPETSSGSTQPGDVDGASSGPRVVTLSDSGKTINLAAGDVVLVRLPTHAGTGYVWQLASGGADAGAAATNALEPHAVGRPSHQTFSFVGRVPGTARVAVVLRRPWESAPPVQTFTIDIVVR